MSPMTMVCLPALVKAAQAVSPMPGVSFTPAAITRRSLRGKETLKTPSFASREPLATVRASIAAVSKAGGAAVDHPLHAGGLGPAEAAVAHVDVVYHLPDRLDRRVGQAKPVRQDLERAPLPLVCVLRLEHVEAQLALAGLVSLRRDELQLGVRIDEAPDQPGAGDAIDMDAGAGHPHGAANGARGGLASAAPLGWRQAVRERRDQGHDVLPARGSEEVEVADLAQTPAQA